MPDRHRPTVGSTGDSPSAVTRRQAIASLASAGVLATAGCQGLPIVREVEPAIAVPERSGIGQPFPIHLEHFDANTPVTVQLRARDSRGEPFRGRATVTTDEDGSASVGDALRTSDGSFARRSKWSSDEAISHGVGGTGPLRMPLHHLTPVNDPAPSHFVDPELSGEYMEPLDVRDVGYGVTVDAMVEGEVVASTTGTREKLSAAVTERRIPADDIVGWLYEPPVDGPTPGVIFLHGSFAEPWRNPAVMLASQGYTTAALQWYGRPDPLAGDANRVSELDDVPLEYFDGAVEWLTARESVFSNRIGLIGASMGVEPALLTASAYDGSATAISYSGRTYAKLGADVDAETPWNRNGEPLYTEEELDQNYGRLSSVDDPREVTQGIALEDIEGPVLLHYGTDDRAMTRVGNEYGAWRLSYFDHPHPYSLVTYEDAGHALFHPYEAYDQSTLRFWGGAQRPNARAAADSWVRTLDYLESGLR